MNDLEFRQRALANPRDDSPEFLAAARQSAERRRLLEEVRAFEERLQSTVHGVEAPAGLRQRLRDPGALASAPGTGGDGLAAGGEGGYFRHPSLWARALPAAACLLVVLGLVIGFWPRDRADSEFEQEVFSHLYREINFLDMNNEVGLPDVNELMAAVGGRFEDTGGTRALEVQVADDCWIARRYSAHLVLKGRRGAVTVMVVPNAPVKKERVIADARFKGVITPTDKGNLVVIGEKDESLERYRDLLADSFSWSASL